MLNNCKVLVTGGAGFIGSHIVTRLARDNDVLIYDNFSSGYAENLAHLKDRSNVKILTVDIRDGAEVNKHMENIDYIFHLAALVSVPQSIKEPVLTIDTNIKGTMNILESARKKSVKKVIFTSSAAVYGDEPTLPKIETSPIIPKSPYAVSKIAGEQYCRMYYELHELPTVVLRFFNVFGPRQDPKSEYSAVVPKFINRVISDKTPIIYGTGEQSRDFIYIDDVVNANLQGAISKKANGGIFNIASGSSTTVNQIAEMVIEFSGKNLLPEYQPPRPGDIIHSYADISKARSFLNWAPKTNIRDGLEATYRYFAKNGLLSVR